MAKVITDLNAIPESVRVIYKQGYDAMGCSVNPYNIRTQSFHYHAWNTGFKANPLH